jgi:hypothetical protein
LSDLPRSHTKSSTWKRSKTAGKHKSWSLLLTWHFLSLYCCDAGCAVLTFRRRDFVTKNTKDKETWSHWSSCRKEEEEIRCLNHCSIVYEEMTFLLGRFVLF